MNRPGLLCSVITMLTPDVAGGFYPFPLQEDPDYPQERRRNSATVPQSGFSSPFLILPQLQIPTRKAA
jgi:hypothetical protein